MRGLHQPWAPFALVEPEVLLAMVVVLPIASASASLLAVFAALRTGLHARLALADLGGAAAMLGLPFLLTMEMGQQVRPMLGVAFVVLLGLRLGPTACLLIAGRLRSPLFAFLIALAAYGALVVWTAASAAFQGDQPHYLLAAERLARGSLDLGPAYVSDALFRHLT
ncbi:MAG: hypothetical protein FJ034_00590, partial [Chloroflexi bacterium]|nr:hypothetical protein [Chloroflexota bacterium]